MKKKISPTITVYPPDGARPSPLLITNLDSSRLASALVGIGGLKNAGLSDEAVSLLCVVLERHHIDGKEILNMKLEEFIELSPQTTLSDAQKVVTWFQEMSEITIPDVRDDSLSSAAAAEPQVALLEQKPEVSVAGDCEDLS